MANRLAGESSPYLLQHQANPVDWYPWGPEALERSRDENLPIFLSIGYSACHWCHVMEHESFEDEAIAALLNDRFVCIKVDREERPDLDQIYMHAVQMMTGHGGWPMSVFLTPDLRPFYGGTYWPPERRGPMPGFRDVIEGVTDAWESRRDNVFEVAGQLTEQLQRIDSREGSDEGLQLDLIRKAAVQLEQAFDFTHGGFGRAPKFPHPMDVQLLLRYWRRHRRDGVLDMVRLTLDKMSHGGIYDHLAGGFARYSVDSRWLVPHFEKMLYDNALLVGAYLDGYLVTGDEHYARTVRETLDYVLESMTDDEGGFHSTEDADSEGEEGKFYVWTPDEIREILGDERAERFCYVYDVTNAGNFEGRNILNLPKTIEQAAALHEWDLPTLRAELAESRQLLLDKRNSRVRPGKDDKVLVSWNGLMIDSMARAGVILDEPAYLQAAQRAARFLLTSLRRDDGRLLHAWRHGRAKLDAYLDDYACLTNALITLYESDFDESWIDRAVELAEQVVRHFSAETGFYYTADDHEPLIARTKDVHDSSVPSGNAMVATAFERLGRLCGRGDLLTAAHSALRAGLSVMERAPTAAGQMLLAVDMYFGPTPELILIADLASSETAEILRAIRTAYVPNRVLACRPDSSSAGSSHLASAFAGKKPIEGQPVLYVCQDFACESPAVGKLAIIERYRALIDGLAE